MCGLAGERHVEVEPASLALRVVVDAVALPRAARDSCTTLHLSGPLVVGELGSVVNRDEDLFAVVVRVQADSTAGWNHSRVYEGKRRARRERSSFGGALEDGTELELWVERAAVRAARAAHRGAVGISHARGAVGSERHGLLSACGCRRHRCRALQVREH